MTKKKLFQKHSLILKARACIQYDNGYFQLFFKGAKQFFFVNFFSISRKLLLEKSYRTNSMTSPMLWCTYVPNLVRIGNDICIKCICNYVYICIYKQHSNTLCIFWCIKICVVVWKLICFYSYRLNHQNNGVSDWSRDPV